MLLSLNYGIKCSLTPTINCNKVSFALCSASVSMASKCCRADRRERRRLRAIGSRHNCWARIPHQTLLQLLAQHFVSHPIHSIHTTFMSQNIVTKNSTIIPTILSKSDSMLALCDSVVQSNNSMQDSIQVLATARPVCRVPA